MSALTVLHHTCDDAALFINKGGVVVLDETYGKFYAILIDRQRLDYGVAETFGGGTLFAYFDSHAFHKGTSRAFLCTEFTFDNFRQKLFILRPGGSSGYYEQQNWANATFFVREYSAAADHPFALPAVPPPRNAADAVPPPSLQRDWALLGFRMSSQHLKL